MPGKLMELLVILHRVLARRRHRRALAGLSRLGERTLRDLGIDPDALRAEMSKPSWRP